MKNNPLDLEPGTVFILGKASDMDIKAQDEFLQFQQKLEKLKIPFVSMQKIFEDLDVEKTFTIDECLKRCASYLSMCDRVATLNDWNFCFHARSLMDVSRAMTKKIFHADRFLELIEKENATA